MERREAVKYISMLVGGTVVGGTAFLTGCKSGSSVDTEFTPETIAYLDEVADTILPRTSTPGAKDAKVGQFMTVMVNDCYEEGDQKAFHKGIKDLEDGSQKKYKKGFLELTPDQKKEYLTALDKESKEYQNEVNSFAAKESEKEVAETAKGKKYVKQRKSPHYFMMMKQLTLLGYFTSKEGMTQAMRYTPVPGRWEGCIDYKKGEKAFS